jgi:hypothetical protein
LEIDATVFKDDEPEPTTPLTFPSLTTIDLGSKSNLSGILIAGLCAMPWPKLLRLIGGLEGWYHEPWCAEDVTALLENAPHLKELHMNGIQWHDMVEEVLQAVCEAGPVKLAILHIDASKVNDKYPFTKAKLTPHMTQLQQTCPYITIHIAVKKMCRLYYGNALQPRDYTECLKPPCKAYSEHLTKPL